MNATRKLAGGAMAAILLVAGCSSAATAPSRAPAPSDPPAPSDALAPSEAPAPSQITAKGGGGVPTPLAATLITGEGTPIDEQAFAHAVLKDSGGSITITVSSKWRSGDPNYEAGVINDVVTGKAQMGVTATRAFDLIGVTAFEGLSAPLLIDSYALEARVLGADVVMKQLDATRAMGVTSLDFLGGPLRQPLGLTRDLVSAGDYAGAKIGIRPSRVSEMAIRALGGTPVAYVPGHVDGLDGLEVHTDLIEGAQYDAGAKSLTGNVVLSARPSVIFVNGAWFDKLPADQQALLRRAAGEAKAASLARWPTDSQVAVETLCRRSLIVKEASGAALAGLSSKLAPVTDVLATDATNKAVIDGIRALGGSDATDFIAPCGAVAASAEPSGAATALDGTWVTSFTKADLQKSPLLFDAGEINDGNWGDLTMTFDHGKFTSTQSNGVGHGTGSGTFTVTGDAVTLHLDQTGETFAFRWSIFKNTLSFKRDETLGVGPTPFLVKPWTRVS